MRKKGSAFIAIGLLLIAAALSLTGYNIWDGRRADEAAHSAAEILWTRIPDYQTFLPEEPTQEQQETPAVQEETSVPEEDPFGDLSEFENREMPATEIDGYRYIGVLDVPSMELSLPVMEEWDYDRLRISPCRFSGSVYRNDMVICAHNYPHHFSPLKYAPIGTQISFTDMDGEQFLYEVISVETVDPNMINQLYSGDWDLTLFTCNTGGQTRCTLRCVRIAES